MRLLHRALDHSNLESLGVPTVTVVTEPFRSAAITHAQIHGPPDLPFIIVPLKVTLEEPSDDVVIERTPPSSTNCQGHGRVGPARSRPAGGGRRCRTWRNRWYALATGVSTVT